jgi:hypothetical protein
MSDLRLLSFYIGNEMCHDDSGNSLQQTHFAKKILEMADMTDFKAATMPLEERLRMSRDSKAEEADVTQYRCIVSSFRYLIRTRLDLEYAVRYVSRFLE